MNAIVLAGVRMQAGPGFILKHPWGVNKANL